MLRSRAGWAVYAALASLAGTWACGSGSSSPDATEADAVVTPDAPPPPDSGPDAIAYDAVVLPRGATCDVPIALNPGDSDSYDTTDLFQVAIGSCSNGSGTGRDAVYVFDMGKTPRDLSLLVSVDEGADPPYDAVLHARTECTSQMQEVACADGGYSEHLEVLAQTGLVYVFVDGTPQHSGASEGAFMLSSSGRDIVAATGSCDPAEVTSRCEDGTRCVSGTCVADSAAVACTEAVSVDLGSGAASVTATTHAYAADHYEGTCPFEASAALPEHIYTFTVGADSTFSATTDNTETNFDTYLYLRAATCSGTQVACHDDVDLVGGNLASTINVASLPANTYYLFVDGSSNASGTGTYRLDFTLTAN